MLSTSSAYHKNFAEVFSSVREASLAFSHATVTPWQRGVTVKHPLETSLSTSAWVGEGVEATPSHPTLDFVEPLFKKVVSVTSASETWLSDTGDHGKAFLVADHVASMSAKVDEAMLTGTAAGGSFDGLLTVLPAGQKVVAGAATLSLGDIKSAMALLPVTAFEQEPVIVMSPSRMAQVADSVVLDRGVRYLLGLPLVLSSQMPSTAGGLGVLVGSLKKSVLLDYVEPGMTTRLGEEAGAANGVVQVISSIRVGLSVPAVETAAWQVAAVELV